MERYCSGEVADCGGACVSLRACAEGCATDACEQTCIDNTSPEAAAELLALLACAERWCE